MLRQAGFQMWAEKAKEQKEYEGISTKGYKFEKLKQNSVNDPISSCENYLIFETRYNSFGYKFEVQLNHEYEQVFYTLANAKRYIVKELEYAKEYGND